MSTDLAKNKQTYQIEKIMSLVSSGLRCTTLNTLYWMSKTGVRQSFPSHSLALAKQRRRARDAHEQPWRQIGPPHLEFIDCPPCPQQRTISILSV